MSYLFDGIDDVLTLASAPVTATPMTFAAWFKTSDVTNNQSLVSIGVTGSANNRFTLTAQGAAAGDPIRATTATTTQATADSTTGYSTGSWQHGCVVFASITDRRAFVNGGSKGTNATSRNPAGVGETLIGLLHNATIPMNGRIAEVCIWSVALSDAEVASIAVSGTDPSTVQSANVLAYWKLRADANDSSGNGRHLTVTGAVLDSDNPWSAGTSETPGRGGVTVGGNGISAAATPGQGAVVAQGTSPTASATVPGATVVVGGTAPTEGGGPVSQTPIPGGVTVGGVVPTARVTATVGGAVVQGLPPGSRVTVLAGGAVVGATIPAARVTVTTGGAVIGGLPPGSATTATPTPATVIVGGRSPGEVGLPEVGRIEAATSLAGLIDGASSLAGVDADTSLTGVVE